MNRQWFANATSFRTERADEGHEVLEGLRRLLINCYLVVDVDEGTGGDLHMNEQHRNSFVTVDASAFLLGPATPTQCGPCGCCFVEEPAITVDFLAGPENEMNNAIIIQLKSGSTSDS